MKSELQKHGWEVGRFKEVGWSPKTGTGDVFDWAWRAVSPKGHVIAGVHNGTKIEAEKKARDYFERMQNLFGGKRTFHLPGTAGDNVAKSRARGGIRGSAARKALFNQ